MRGSTVKPVMTLVNGISDYQIHMLAGMRAALSERGIPLLVVTNEPFASEGTPSLVLDLIRRRVVCGVIALANTSETRAAELPDALTAARLPAVTVASRMLGMPGVHSDGATGMRELMGHLLDERGARRICLVRGIPHQADSVARETVFREECATRGVPVDDETMVDGEFRASDTYQGIHRLLGQGRRFDAVVALNDASAFGAMAALIDHGLRIPEDVMLTGFDNTISSTTSWPSLTTIDQCLPEQGRAAVDLLMRRIDGDQSVTDVHVPSRLVVRASTTSVAGGLLDSEDPECLATLAGVRMVDGLPLITVRRAAHEVREVASVARALQARTSLQEAAMLLSWSMANCRTLDDVTEALDRCLKQMGIRRFFLGIAHSPAPGDRMHEADHPTTLVLDDREGQVMPASTEVYPRHELLPSGLRSELDKGVLTVQALSIAGRERGFLLSDLPWESALLSEALRIELPRTIDMVLSSQELKDHATMLERLVTQRTRELERANAELQRSVTRDGLTGIANRVAFQQYLEQSCRPVPGTRRSVALLMIDVDMFKAYNDHYGHLAGDDALRAVAACLARSVRATHDLACRYGGEEFAVVLQDSSIEAATAVAERFAELLAETAIPHEASPVAAVVTASVGVAAATVTAALRPTDLIARADQALYQAKIQGRQRIVVADAGRDVPRPRASRQPARSSPLPGQP